MPIISLAALLLAKAGHTSISISVISKSIEGLHPIAFAPAPDGSKFAMTLDDNSVRIMDAATRQTIKVFKGHPFPAHAIAWSQDGEYIASGDESARIFIWDVHTGQKVRTLIGHQRPINKLSFNSSRTLLLSDGDDSLLCVWNVVNGKKVGEIRGGNDNVYGATFAPKADIILVGMLGGGARLYRMTSAGPKLMNFMNFASPSGQVHGALDACFGPSGKVAATAGNDGQAILWDTVSYKRLGAMKGHDVDGMLRDVVFSPNGKLIATSATDRTVRLWDSSTLQTVDKINDECAVSSPLAFTSDGKYLIAVDVSDNLQINAITPSQGTQVAAAKPVKGRKGKG